MRDMPPPVRLSRNITDFFRPFSQPRETSDGQESLGGRSRTAQEDRTRPGNAEKQLHHETSTDFDKSDAKLSRGVANLVAIGQDLVNIGRTPPSPDVALPQTPVYKKGTGNDGTRSSSLTPLESDSPSPVEEVDPTFNERGSFHSTMSTKADYSRSFGEDSFASGSQRVVRNGEIVIANSDEDTDSQDSFEDLDELLHLPKQGSRMSHPSPQPETMRIPYTLRSKHSSKKVKPSYSLRSSSANAKTPGITLRTTTRAPKFSLQALVAQTAADQAVETAAQQAEDSLKTVNDDTTRSLEIQKNLFGGVYEEGVVRTAELGDSDEDRKIRLVRAVQRSQLLQREKTWSFFDISGSKLSHSTVAFPDCTTQGKWATQLQGSLNLQGSYKWLTVLVPALREQAFLSGFVAEVASRGRLPADLLLWVIDACKAHALLHSDRTLHSSSMCGEIPYPSSCLRLDPDST